MLIFIYLRLQQKNQKTKKVKPIKEGFIVAVDIRDITDQNTRQRIVDFITGIAFISDAKMRIILPRKVNEYAKGKCLSEV